MDFHNFVFTANFRLDSVLFLGIDQLNSDGIIKLAEISGVNIQVTCYVFMRNQVQNLGAPGNEIFNSFFNAAGMKFGVPGYQAAEFCFGHFTE